MSQETVFHKIVKGEAPCYKVWEDEDHLAFLTPFPNTEGFTVLIPKQYQPSYFAEVDDEPLFSLIKAAKKVARVLEDGLDDVGRVGMIFEGFGVDYLHAKLVPMHGTADMEEWREIKSDINTYFERYPGYVSSHDSDKVSDDKLATLAEKIRVNA
ncbi:MAG: HIT family protein [Candidatus Paceibacterota bacterium]